MKMTLAQSPKPKTLFAQEWTKKMKNNSKIAFSKILFWRTTKNNDN